LFQPAPAQAGMQHLAGLVIFITAGRGTYRYQQIREKGRIFGAPFF
jgi:hypothetical protein